jgi:hypothetical protein
MVTGFFGVCKVLVEDLKVVCPTKWEDKLIQQMTLVAMSLDHPSTILSRLESLGFGTSLGH